MKSYRRRTSCERSFAAGTVDRCLLEKAGHAGDHHGTSHDWPNTVASAATVVFEEQSAFDPVNRPEHYATLDPEPITVIEGWKLTFCLGNALKYIARAGKKDPSKTVEDIRKAIWYLDREASRLERGGSR